MSGWQPIRTAPEDGTRLLVWNSIWVDIVYREEGQGWLTLDSEEITVAPTHWMPLPDPPKESE